MMGVWMAGSQSGGGAQVTFTCSLLLTSCCGPGAGSSQQATDWYRATACGLGTLALYYIVDVMLFGPSKQQVVITKVFIGNKYHTQKTLESTNLVKFLSSHYLEDIMVFLPS